ncbi:MAG: S8 family serine peptidase [Pyrinomonadaceae bacterium]
MKRIFAFFLLIVLAANPASAGILFVRSSGITLTGADGVKYVGASGITLTGADGLLNYGTNGITLTGADGITLTGADGITLTGADGTTYVGSNGITLTGADGITLTGADGITLTGADGITLTGADGSQYRADSIVVRRPQGITLTGADGINVVRFSGITLTGADGMVRRGVNGITLTGADGITLTGADGITLTGADGITLTGADGIVGVGAAGVLFELANPSGITLTGADGITLTGADGITLTGADGITLTGADQQTGLQGLDPEVAMWLNTATDDSTINCVIVYHGSVTNADLDQLRSIGILGGTRMKVLPMVYVSATKQQILAVSALPRVRSIYGNRTLTFDADPYLDRTGIQKVSSDADLRTANSGLPVTGRGITVAVLDTGVNGQLGDLAGRMAQNVRLTDLQSAPFGFTQPAPIENLANTDLVAGHGTFVAGLIAGSGAASNGKFNGVAPGAKLLGLSAGDANLTYVLAGFDYLLDRGAAYGVKVVNCSFSAAAPFDLNDPVNIATKILTDRGINVVFSAGNGGPGNGTMNPYAAAPWVVSVGATDRNGRLAGFSARGSFGDELQHPTLLAPGVDVVSLRSLATTTSGTGLGGADPQRLTVGEMPHYTTGSGTSFSAPQVAGTIALMLETNPNLTPAEIKDILARTATPLPNYFYHEAGAGMLNSYAAVLGAAFPNRRVGIVRAANTANTIRFVTSTPQTFTQHVVPGSAAATPVQIPANTVQATISIAWAVSANDFGLSVTDGGNSVLGRSNYLNLPVITGRRERVVLRDPAAQTVTASTRHTGGAGTSQTVNGVLEVTQIQYPELLDTYGLSSAGVTSVQRALLTGVMLPLGRKFRPASSVSRFELAESIVRAGLVPQYVSGTPMYLDVRDPYSRNAVESVQADASRPIVFDASTRFEPSRNATKLVAAVALVRAAGLDSAAAGASLPATVSDAAQIPAAWRGFVAVALQRGFLTLDGGQFNGSRSLTRLELASALEKILSN